MSPVHLRRIDAERNMRRFYELDVRPNLFGHWAFIREWGRIGSPGQVMTLLFPTFEEAHAALERQQRVKVGRGYIQTLRAREGSCWRAAQRPWSNRQF